MITLFQFIRYAIVGLSSNLLLFLLYLGATRLGLGPKLAMSILYLLGVLLTFLFNRRWSFRHGGTVPKALIRYFLAYLSGYLVNLAVLYYLVDVRGFDHKWVQGCMILLLAVMLFLLQKFWVFRDEKPK